MVAGQSRCAYQAACFAPDAKAYVGIIDISEFLGIVICGIEVIADIKRPVDAVCSNCLGVIECDDIHDAAERIKNPLAVTYDVHA